METRARYALIGAFMLAVIAASFAFRFLLEVRRISAIRPSGLRA